MRMDKERFLSSGLLEQYVLGLTTPEESEEVERYVEAFPEIKRELDNMRKALEQYAMQHSIPPPPQLKDSILEEIEQGGTPAASPPRWMFTLTAIAAVVFGIFSAVFFQRQHQAREAYNKLKVEYALFQEDCEESRQNEAKLRQLYAFLADNDTQPVLLSGTALAPDASAIVYWNDRTQKAYFNAITLPEAPPEKQYQIWADVDGEMINLGLLDRDLSNLQMVSYIGEAESLNVTLEPVGGSEHPTVEQLFINGRI